MPLVLGLDLGTTTITALALDTDTGEVAGRRTKPNHYERTPQRRKVLGFSEWDHHAICTAAEVCLGELLEELAARRHEVKALAVTGQQHGVVVSGVGLINWQDQRGQLPFRGEQTFTARVRELLGEAARERTGCSPATGYLAVSLFWLKHKKRLPAEPRAEFLADYFLWRQTFCRPTTDATFAASSGVYDVKRQRWDKSLLAALGLSPNWLPRVRPVGTFVGKVRSSRKDGGLPAGLPVYLGLGDNQASFLGSVASPDDSVLVNVGTGGQVSVYLPEYLYDPALETRPFPGGYLLVCAGLTGGRVYAVLENFYRQIGRDLFGRVDDAALYATMNRLAATAPPGCDGLRCEPYFSGTRQQPDLRGSWSGVSTTNFTPAHLTRALLEGMARSFTEGLERMTPHLPRRPRQLIAAGNGMRENPLLRQLVGEAFGLKVLVPRHREEAAYGAALTAAVGAGIFPDFRTAAQLIRYEEG